MVFAGDQRIELASFPDPIPGLGEVVLGSWTFSTVGQADCAIFIADRKIGVDALSTDRWKLDQADEAYRLFDRQTGGKGVFLL